MLRNPVFESVVHTHLMLREATSRIGRTEAFEAVEGALAQLASILPDHFHAEERANGFFDHLRRSLDDAEEQVDGLCDEHRAMEHELSALLGPGDHDRTWLRRAKELARHLEEHETREARLGVVGFESF